MTTRIVTPFNSKSTAADVVGGVDLKGRRVVVTGAASGIGLETARALAGAGAEVTIAVRNIEAGRRAAEDIDSTSDARKVHVSPLDLADQASVASFVSEWDGPLHILINNAGIMASPEMRTPEGWEMQFATNHLGHFALAVGLHRALAAAAAERGEARVVSVSSGGHLRSPVVFDDIHFQVRPYNPWMAYAQSKTANVLFAVEANKRWARDGVIVNAAMPGTIQSNLLRYLSAEETQMLDAAIKQSPELEWKTPEQGAATSVLLAASPLIEGVGGRYFEDCNEAEPNQTGSARGVAAHALDPEAAARLWEASLAMLRA